MVDRELNPEGSEFKPLRAIYDPAFEVSDNAVVQDNVEKCIAVIEGRVRTKKVAKEEEEEKKGGEVVKLERQFKPEQLAQPTRPRRLKKGVLERRIHPDSMGFFQNKVTRQDFDFHREI